MKRLLALIIVLALVACSSEKPGTKPAAPPEKKAAPSAPVAGQAEEAERPKPGRGKYELLISPAEAGVKTNLKLLARGFSLEDAVVTWLVNDAEVYTRSELLFVPADERAGKGDRVQARADVEGVEVYSNLVTIMNTRPELTGVKIMPEVFGPGDKVRVEAEATDPDNDPLGVYYEWTRNDIPAGTGRALEVKLKRGDVFTVKITPFDGEAYGRPIMLHRQVGNMPPIFEESNKYQFVGQTYTFQARAYDPDGDEVSYALKNSPEGMTVDRITGLVNWVVPADFEGKQSFTLSATDGQGGEALYTFRLTFALTNAPAISNAPGEGSEAPKAEERK
jgi:hypothetical protein